MKKRQSEYKPLLFTTTMRNPERLKDFLTVLSEYDGEILTNGIIDKVAKILIQKGWPSRFDTWFKIAKELGFIWYWPNEEIKFSESGKMLLDKEKPENELMVFANAFAKYQRQNPFRRVLNKNVPLILLIQTIKLLE